jgi:hypothetical protein
VDRLGKDECAEQVLTSVWRLIPGCCEPSASTAETPIEGLARLLAVLAPIVADLALGTDPTRLPA